MKFKKIYSIVALLIMAITILYGCEPQGEDYPVTEADFRVGNDGIKIEFMQGAPPKSAYEAADVEISPQLRNEGAYNATGIVTISLEQQLLCLKGNDGKCINYVEQNIAQKAETNAAEGTSEENNKNSNPYQKEFSILGKSLGNPRGDFVIKSYNAIARDIGTQITKRETAVIATACYTYSTELTDTVCVDPDIYGTTATQKACEMRTKQYINQGSPLAIKSIEMNMKPIGDMLTPEIIVNVKNVGRGNVIDSDSISKACSAAGLDRELWNNVDITEISLGSHSYGLDGKDNKISCRKTKLVNGEGRIVCTLNEQISRVSPAYETQLRIKIDFGYMQSERTTLDIERIA